MSKKLFFLNLEDYHFNQSSTCLMYNCPVSGNKIITISNHYYQHHHFYHLLNVCLQGTVETTSYVNLINPTTTLRKFYYIHF